MANRPGAPPPDLPLRYAQGEEKDREARRAAGTMRQAVASLPPFRAAKGRVGEGLIGHGESARSPPSRPPPALRARGGEGPRSSLRCRNNAPSCSFAPSLSRSEGEGWGGVDGHSESARRTPSRPPPPLRARGGEGPRSSRRCRSNARGCSFAPSLSRSEGEGWGGVDRAWRNHAAGRRGSRRSYKSITRPAAIPSPSRSRLRGPCSPGNSAACGRSR